jgi:hypothetical protein
MAIRWLACSALVEALVESAPMLIWARFVEERISAIAAKLQL